MKQFCRRWFIGVSLLAMLAVVPSLKAETEDQLIANLSLKDEGKVVSALAHLEKDYPTSTKALPIMKKLLTDSRVKIRRKAARVLGALHAEVNAEDIKAICALLKESSAESNIDGLKALRGLHGASSACPDIFPLLTNANNHVKRDACRTLAVIGGKDAIPQIEPLLTFPDPAVQKDAQDAIDALKSKS